MSFVKSETQTKYDIDLLNKRIHLLTKDMIEEIKSNADVSPDCLPSIFRPDPDFAMLLFKVPKSKLDAKHPTGFPSENPKSVYTINLLTLKPTANSVNKTPIPEHISKLLQ